MGGSGSGRHFYNTRPVKEDSLVLDGYQVLPKLIKDSKHYKELSGVISWSRPYREKFASIAYTFENDSLVISYIRDKTESIQYSLNLVPTMQPKGGYRYWFKCPIVHCGRLAAKLYKPVGSKYFGCRICHNLTYESSNESHRFDSFFRSINCKNAKEAREKVAFYF